MFREYCELEPTLEALRIMEQEYALLMSNIPAIVFKGYLDGSIDLFDQKVEALTGFPQEEFASRRLKWSDLILEEDRQPTKLIFLQALKGDKAYVREYRIRDKQGNLIWIQERSHIVGDAGGRAKSVSGLFFDLTEQKRLEEKLGQTEKAFHIVMDNIPAVLFKGGIDGSIDTFDDKIETLTGYPKAEFDSRRLIWTELIFPEDLDSVKQAFIHALKTNKSYLREYRIRPKTGNVVWVHERSHIVCDPDGKVVYVSGLFFDITERKELEATVAEQNSQLSEANNRLASWAQELEQRNDEINLLGRLGELLQSCNTSAEAALGIGQSVQNLFPGNSGAVYLFNSSRNLLEAATLWGPAPPSETVFAPDECWALRRGRPHGSAEIAAGFTCRHVQPDQPAYVCMPLVAQGEAIGVFHVLLGATDPMESERKENLALRVSEHLGLALAKLKLQEALQHLSVRDPLTGLFNRRYMEESMQRELIRAGRQDKEVGVIMLDIDHFKRFNDNFGHDGGDALLRKLGKFLQNHVRASDVACRYGGEEFTLILPEASLEITRQRAEQILVGVRDLRVRQGQKILDSITLSLGVAVFPKHGTTHRALLQAADVALYCAKETGRDRVCLAGKD
jgi:diguanylate cyclase (GGDEF)-like protein/PAS domain S-box-containing protein